MSGENHRGARGGRGGDTWRTLVAILGYSMILLGIACLALLMPLLLSFFIPGMQIVLLTLLITGPLAIGIGFGIVAKVERRTVFRHGRCRGCGYDLRGGHKKCPECGKGV